MYKYKTNYSYMNAKMPSLVGRAIDDAILRVDASFGPDNFGYGIASTAIMFGVIVGGLFILFWLRQAVLWFMAWRSRYFCAEKYLRVGTRVVNEKTSETKRTPIYVEQEAKNHGKAVAHVSIEFVFLLLGVAAVWFGYFSAGFNFLNSPYLGLALSLCGTYMFGAALQNLSAKIFNNAENIFPIGTYLRIPALGPEVHGFFAEQTAFHIILVRKDAEGARRRIKVTCADFFNATVIEDTYSQYNIEEWQALEVSQEVLDTLKIGVDYELRSTGFANACGLRSVTAQNLRFKPVNPASASKNYKNV
jgi:hypothetical protein